MSCVVGNPRRRAVDLRPPVEGACYLPRGRRNLTEAVVSDVHDTLSVMWGKGVFEPAIHYIRFPVFKNLTTNMRIDFNHPVTAIVGPNGCNKTAILRALQGCPSGNDLGNYWFGTAMDTILPDARHRFIYGRKSDSVQPSVEVIKTRIGRRRSSRSKKEIDPDLFEPSRPLTRPPDNMAKYPFNEKPPLDGSTTRWNTIDKPVLYLDFRSQLSAFDWAFYHSESNRAGAVPFLQGLRLRKSVIRNRSKRLAAAIGDGRRSDLWYGTERIIEAIHSVSDEELAEIQTIIGREYQSIRMIHHRYFGKRGGWTVLMKSSDIQYSEAFAGSGEYAAVMLVCSVLGAKTKSLILLDEPEVSLHPAAQRAVMDFLATAALRKHHQIVLATHAPEMVRALPVSAIKVLSVRADDGKIDIPSQRASPHAAFEAVGASYDHPPVVVEDRLAAAMVTHAIKDLPISDSVTVKFIPGGADTLWSHYVPMWAQDERDSLLLLLDGDQTTDDPPVSTKVASDDLEDVLVSSLNGNKPKLPYGGSEAQSDSHRRESLQKVLDWRRKFVRFLPVKTPEEYLLQARAARLGESLSTAEIADPKSEWDRIACNELGRQATGGEIFLVQEMEINKLSPKDQALRSIAVIVSEFVQGLRL
jgi:ABC-type transport system involved in cytochrome c biogenesis ATPase subunit